MSANLVKINYPYEDREFIANSFIIGNGRIGYKGTMEEETCSDKVTLNVVGVYDQSGDQWRESLNVFNPLFTSVKNIVSKQLYHYKDAIEHKLELDLERALVKRTSVFHDLRIESERFIHKKHNLIAHQYVVHALSDVELEIKAGVDLEVYEINGPHFQQIEHVAKGTTIKVSGTTNENSLARVFVKQVSSKGKFIYDVDKSIGVLKINLLVGEQISITRFANVVIDDEKEVALKKLDYESCKTEHSSLFSKAFTNSRIVFSEQETQFASDYSIYHLLILENINYKTSIPARGLSGQVYKGAIFWDTEVFMLPFYLLTNPQFARNLIEYRINTLPGALHKAKEFGYKGAFYAWESQEDGRERCSLYNVTDAKTNRPIRTYFADKQIHISADVVYGLKKYLEYTDDYSILEEGGFDVIREVAVFYESYATLLNDKFHFLDVVGPDEYHERVDDNAFTNYHVYLTFKALIKLIYQHYRQLDKISEFIDLVKINAFINKIYLPPVNEDGIIEQFDGYFALEDIDVATLKTRITNPKAYLGGEEGIATPTRVIKQADVVALFALHFDSFELETIIKNYEFYENYTEHGSSLSSSAYGLISARIGALDKAYKYFYRSATIDLQKDQKLYAGGIFIGGTHPASSGGAYNIIVYGFLGAHIEKGKLKFKPQIPDGLGPISLQYTFKNKLYTRSFNND